MTHELIFRTEDFLGPETRNNCSVYTFFSLDYNLKVEIPHKFPSLPDGNGPGNLNKMTAFKQDLGTRRIVMIPHSIEEERHHKICHFIDKNWSVLFGILYPRQITFGALASFREVNLSNKGTIDVVAFGPNEQVFIIEVGRKGKTEPLTRYAEGLKFIASRQGLKEIYLVPLFVKYRFRRRRRAVSLTFSQPEISF